MNINYILTFGVILSIALWTTAAVVIIGEPYVVGIGAIIAAIVVLWLWSDDKVDQQIVDIEGEYTPLNTLYACELRRNHYAGLFWAEVGKSLRLKELCEWLNIRLKRV